MKIIYLLSVLLLLSCSQEKTIHIYKQWHLSPNVKTLNINNSLKLPQAAGQLKLYKKISDQIEKEKITIIAEGCEGDPKLAFNNKYNGWNLKSLEEKKSFSNFDNILAPIPMKLMAKYPKRVKVICGDSDELIKKHNLVFSDIKGFFSFYEKLKKLDVSDPYYEKYLKALESVLGKNVTKPLALLKSKILKRIDEFESLLIQRNKFFIEKASQEKGTVVIIIGALHVEDLRKKLEALGKNVRSYELGEANVNDKALIDKLKKVILKDSSLILNQVPHGFNLKLFPLKNLYDASKLASAIEWKELAAIAKELHLDERYLLSDYDKDGIRDFTLSRSEDKVILTAEDKDWDNDGVLNLNDESIGKVKVALKAEFNLSNVFEIAENKESLEKQAKNNKLSLLSMGIKHDAIVLKVFFEVLKKLKNQKLSLKFIIAKKPSFSYGKKVFFSYVPSTESLEYYPDKLFEYLKNKKEKQYKRVSINDFVNGVAIPLLVHSISHELVHSMKEIDIIALASANKWSFSKNKLNTKYLEAGRVKSNIKSFEITGQKYAGKSYVQWLATHKSYVQTVNKLLKKKGNFRKWAKSTPWYTGTSNKTKEYQVSFLAHHAIPSIYATSNYKEWAAETLSMCIFRMLYPLEDSKEVSAKYEVLLGINPLVAQKKLCEKYDLW